MSNLLPIVEKRLLLREYRLRTGIAILYFLGALAAIGAVALIPSLVRVHSLVSSVERARQFEEKTLEQLGASAVAHGFREANEELASLASILTEPELAVLVHTVAVVRPASVSIQSIAYEPKGDGAGSLTLGGTAMLRDDLLQFVEALRREAAFVAVNLPIGALARERDANFTISVKL
ncbi:MAG: hypothetical protein U1A28_02705, partial [Patescibacteria group bacterium]|nr:hypothetical protein [Patescibacteria group bacterium]